MKNLLILFTLLTLLSCEMYELESDPRLTGGIWIFSDYEILVTSSIGDVEVIKSDTVCINSFNNQSVVSGDILMSQIYEQTAKDRRFIIGQTMWEFDNSNYYLYCDFNNRDGSLSPSHDPFWVNIDSYSNKLRVDDTENGGSTTWTYQVNGSGAFPPTVMKLLSPPIVTDLYISNGMWDKAVTVRVLLTFMR